VAIKRFRATIIPARAGDNVQYQRVDFVLNGEVIDTKTVPAEGGPVQSVSFELPSDRDNVLEMLVTPVDVGGKAAPAPAITRKTFQGEDTIPPETPDPSDFEVVDGSDEEGSGPGEAPAAS
jgi:hypothetical protein